MEDLKRQTYMLLLNMLPEHVADHFLRRPSDSDELYSQSYDCTSVIFASIPGFSTYYQETEAVDGQVNNLRWFAAVIYQFREAIYSQTPL